MTERAHAIEDFYNYVRLLLEKSDQAFTETPPRVLYFITPISRFL